MSRYLSETDALNRELILGYLRRERRLKRHFRATRLWMLLVRNAGHR